MASTFNVILIHSSEALYNLALKKVQSFVKGRILETKIAGRIAASLCRCLVRARPAKGLAAFVPDACEIISDLLTEDMINHEDLIDEELKFNMHVLSEVSTSECVMHAEATRSCISQHSGLAATSVRPVAN